MEIYKCKLTFGADGNNAYNYTECKMSIQPVLMQDLTSTVSYNGLNEYI